MLITRMNTREQALQSLGKEAMFACYVDRDVLACAQRFAQSEEFAATLKQISPRGKSPKCLRLLDVGAGNGIASWAFATHGLRVTALEPSDSEMTGRGAIAKLNYHGSVHISILDTWGEKIPTPEESFDLIYGRSVLHHARDLKAMIGDLHRVLVPCGKALFAREHVVDNPEDLKVFLRSHKVNQLTGEEYAYSVPEYKRAFREAGFKENTIIGPLESPINSYPKNKSRIRSELIQGTKAVLGRRIACLFCHWPLTRKMLARIHKHTDTTPGRLFTFRCVK